MYHVPHPSNQFTLQKALVEAFDSRGDGKLRWFSGPPIDVVEVKQLHSLDYAAWKASRPKSERTKVEMEKEVVMDVDGEVLVADPKSLEEALNGRDGSLNLSFNQSLD